MAIWIGDYLHCRKELDEDGLLLYGDIRSETVYAVPAGSDGRIFGGPSFAWEGEIPEQHPDDVAFDIMAMDRMKEAK